MTIEITLLGTFEVRRDGEAVPAGAWSRRHAAALVKLLALSPGRRLHREQVIDALWPDLAVDEAAPRLHKAAYFARKAAGDDAVVLRGESVALFPDQSVTVDLAAVRRRRRRGTPRRRRGTPPSRVGRAAVGDLLPDDLYEEWAEAPSTAGPPASHRLAPAPSPLGRTRAARPDRRGGPSRAHARPLGARATGMARCASSSGSTGPWPASSAWRPSKEAVALRDALLDAGGDRASARRRGRPRRTGGGARPDQRPSRGGR